MAGWPVFADGIIAWIGPTVLVVARVGGLTATAPALGAPGLGWRIRVGMTALVSAIVVTAAQRSGVPTGGTVALAAGVAAEAVLGVAMGVAFGLVIAGARQAGEWIGLQAGLAPATIFDPDSADGLTAAGHLLGLLALGAFLAIDGPLRLVTALIESYDVFPAGGPSLNAATVHGVFARVGWALELSLRAAAPVGLALLAAGLTLGLLCRVGGALQLASLAWPARTVLAVFLVLLTIASTIELLRMEWIGMFESLPVATRAIDALE
jgi:flagellar biosynthetic protein FliR